MRSLYRRECYPLPDVLPHTRLVSALQIPDSSGIPLTFHYSVLELEYETECKTRTQTVRSKSAVGSRNQSNHIQRRTDHNRRVRAQVSTTDRARIQNQSEHEQNHTNSPHQQAHIERPGSTTQTRRRIIKRQTRMTLARGRTWTNTSARGEYHTPEHTFDAGVPIVSNDSIEKQQPAPRM